MKPAYSVKDAATILGCTPHKVRQYIKYNMLDSFRVGYKKMIRSESIKKLIQNNL
jgi:predicted transcriptional regulator